LFVAFFSLFFNRIIIGRAYCFRYMLLPANLVIGSVQRDVPRQYIEIKACLRELDYKNFKSIIASSIQIDPVLQALASKK
jgi:hypothetical protein